MKKLTISMDFDGVLTELPMRNLAKALLEANIEVFVTTSRSLETEGLKLYHTDLFAVTDSLGIKRENIIFTNYNKKYSYVKDFTLHFDDNPDEIDLINDYPTGICLGMWYQHNYRQENNQKTKF